MEEDLLEIQGQVNYREERKKSLKNGKKSKNSTKKPSSLAIDAGVLAYLQPMIENDMEIDEVFLKHVREKIKNVLEAAYLVDWR
jgi:hypothetical protein